VSGTRSGIRDNRSRGSAHDFITSRVGIGSALSVVSAYFTTFAYERLRGTLDGVGAMRFLFGEPRFLRDSEALGLVPPAFTLDESGLRLSEQMRQRAVALRCAAWIRAKVAIRSVKRAGLLHGKLIHVTSASVYSTPSTSLPPEKATSALKGYPMQRAHSRSRLGAKSLDGLRDACNAFT
jgi:hypothetical protein